MALKALNVLLKENDSFLIDSCVRYSCVPALLSILKEQGTTNEVRLIAL